MISISPSRAILILVAIGLCLELTFAATLLRPFYLPRHYSIPLLDLGKLTSYSVDAGMLFLFTCILAFALYYAGFRLVAHVGGDASCAVVILAFAAIFCGTLAMVYPYGAADIFDYLSYGRLMATYGVNPFLHAPAEFPHDPFLPYVAWRFLPFTYGPLWAALSAALSRLGGDELLSNILLYKGLAIGFYGGTLWLIHSILRRLSPRYAVVGLVFFAWNPLVLTETAANGHNDVVMMFFVLLAIRLALMQRSGIRMLTLAALAASVLVKFITAMLAPLFVVSLWRQSDSVRRRAATVIAGLAASLTLTITAYAPFWEGPATLAVQRRDELFTASIPAVLKMTLEGPLGVADGKIVGLVVLVAFGLYCLVEAWRLPRGVAPLVAASYRLILFYLLFACLWFQPWYLVWLLALAAIRPGLDTAHLSMLFSFTATMNYFVFGYLWIWNAARLDFLTVQFIAVATIYTLPLTYGLWLLWRGRPQAKCTVLVRSE